MLQPKVRLTCFGFYYFLILIFFKPTITIYIFLTNLLATVVSKLLGHEAHPVSLTGLGELAHFSPLVCIRIIVQHLTQILSTMSPCKTLEYYASLVAAIPHLTP